MRFLFLFTTVIFTGWFNSCRAQQTCPLKKVSASQVVEKIDSSTKPYTWIILWVPNCSTGASDFEQYLALEKKHAYNVVLQLVSVTDDTTTLNKLCQQFQYSKEILIIDPQQHGNDHKIHLRFARHLRKALQLKHRAFHNHYVINTSSKKATSFFLAEEREDFIAPYLK
jgi:hypothetical protein